MGLCWTLDLPTQLFIFISGQQRRITTLAELNRHTPAKSKVQYMLHKYSHMTVQTYIYALICRKLHMNLNIY